MSAVCMVCLSSLFFYPPRRPMNAPHNAFRRANDSFRKADHASWHRHQSRLHILRSQLGFTETSPSRPKSCLGCEHYHGVAYGYGDRRQMLICGFHPFGWEGEFCPDWSESL